MVKLRELAENLGAELAESAEQVEVRRVSGLSDATPDSIVFASDPETLQAAFASNAGAVIAPLNSEGDSKPLLKVKHPKLAFARAAQQLTPMRAPAGIHPTAVVAELGALDEGVSVGPYCVIAAGVRIGANTQILPHVTIYPGVSIGKNCVVQAGTVLGATGFGYARDGETGEYILFPQQGTLAIEDNVEIGANSTIDRGALGETRIGRGTKIDNMVHIAHNCRIGQNVVIAAQTGISGSSVVEDGAILGGQVGIGEHATVGSGVILGGGAGVLSGKKMHGPGEVFWGRPARPLKEYLRDLARLKKR